MTTMLRYILAVVGLLFMALPAQAQSGCNGQLPAGWVCGNYTGAAGFPGAASLSTFPATTQAFTDTSTTKIATDAFVKAQVNSQVCNIVTDGGATKNGSTDDIAAWNFCNSALLTAGGGFLYNPPGTSASCLKSTFAPNTGVVLLGAGNAYGDSDNPTNTSASVVSNCGVDVTIFNFNAANGGMYHMDVEGMTFGASQPTVTTGSSAARNYFWNNNINGGAPPLKIAGCTDCVFEVNRVTHAYGGTTTANVLVQNGGFHGIRNVFNTHWVCLPTAAFFTTDIPAWSATTWPACSVVSAVGPDGGTYFIQTVAGGTSTGSQPTILPYGNNITDSGGVVWLLLRPQGTNIVGGTVTHSFFDLQCDTGCNGVDEYATDHSGAAIGIGMTNTLSGAAPSNVSEINGFFGNNLGDGIAAQFGNQLSVVGGNANTCATTNCAAIDTLSTWTGTTNVGNIQVWAEVFGMRIRGGRNFTITGSTIVGSSLAAIAIAANVNDVIANDNYLGSDATYGANLVGVSIAAGTGNYLTVQGNDFNGATTPMSNGASGANNNLCPNVGLCASTTVLLAPTTYYANASTGVDNNICSVTLPCQTVQALFNLLNRINNGGNAVTLQLADGSYPAGAVCNGPFTGNGIVTLKGNTTTWTNVVLNSGATGIGLQVMNNCLLNVTGMQIKGNSDLIQTIGNGQVSFSDIDFAATSGGAQIAVRNEGFAQQVGPINISGLTGNHALFNNNGVYQEQGQTTTFGGAFTFTAYLAGNFVSSAKVTNNTYTLNGHSQTGSYYALTQGSQLFTNGQYCTTGLPGNASGTAPPPSSCQ